jgi:hypothetical protein
MAHIPDIATSTRRIETMPSRNFAPSVWGEATRDIASAGHALAGLAHRARMAQEANDRREAEYNIALADNFYRNAAVGHEVVDPQTGEKKFVPGRLSLTRKQMDAEGTDSVKITRSIVDDMHSQDWYRSMKPSVRKLFDRKFALRRDAWLRAAGENDIRANLADHVEKTKEYMALNAQGVASVYGADTPTFENTATNAAFRNMMFLEESAIENEDEFDSVPVTAANLKEEFSKIRWNAGVTDEYKNRVYNRMLKGVHEFEVNRISALTMAGAKGESLGALSPEECLSTAEGMIDALREKTLSDVNPVTGKPTELMTEDQSAALKGEIGKAWKILRAKNYQRAHENAMKTEISMFTKKMPDDADGVSARLDANAYTYERMAEDEALPVEVRRSYAHTAQRLRDGAKDMLNAKKKAEMQAKEKQNEYAYQIAYANFSSGMDIATGKEISYDEMAAKARDMLISGTVTPMQYNNLMSIQRRQFTDTQKAFRDKVFSKFPKLLPNVTIDRGGFRFKPTDKVPSADRKSGYEVDLERGLFNDTEGAFTYGNFVTAMNICLDMGKVKGWSETEMMEQFDRMTAEDQTKANARNVDELLSAIRQGITHQQEFSSYVQGIGAAAPQSSRSFYSTILNSSTNTVTGELKALPKE